MMLTDADRETLLEIARHSIGYGLQHGEAAPVTVTDYGPALQESRATFVTLTIHGNLRGCIGTLQAFRPLVEDVAHNAFAAAFHDPRFPRLTRKEFEQLELHISILTTPEPITFKDEQDLLAQLRPDVDGLILEEGFYRGTFLPQVWEGLPNPTQFLRHLKQKAGLPPDYWSKTIRVERYTVEEF
jgi:AmmeMemoRadiSam system protein A